MNRKEYLESAMKIVCQDRKDVHGSPEDCFGTIARYWNAFLSGRFDVNPGLSPADVAVMMALFKTARWQMNPDHQDNLLDNLGYTALAGELQDGGADA